MTVRKRTRPVVETRRPIRTVEMPLNAPYPGCCVPYPDLTFVNQQIVKLFAHHHGPRCWDYLEPIPLEDWNAEVSARAAARCGLEGDVR